MASSPDAQALAGGSVPDIPVARGHRSHPLAWFIGKRLLSGLAALLIATILIFVAVQVLPGNVAEVVLGRSATPERVEQTEARLGLDRSLPSRYWTFLSGMVTGDFGNSSAALVTGKEVSVSSTIGTALRNSLVLAVITILIFVPLCLFLGALSALRAGRKTDHAISSLSLVFVAMPEFLVGTLLVAVVFTQLELLPAVSSIEPGETPFSHPDRLILPVLTLLAVGLAFGTRLVRASMIEVLNEDYVNMARLNGINERRVTGRYVMRNAVAPAVQILAQEIQYLIGGIIVVESVFNYPGIGTTLVRAVAVRDVQVIVVVATLLAAVYVTINIVADVIVVLLIPKLRTSV